MVGYRYLVTSLAAVFIALGIGIFIGNFLGKTELTPDLSGSVHLTRTENAEDQVTALLTNNLNLTEMVGIYEEFSRILRNSLLKDALHGRKLALIITGHQEAPAGMLELLELAGAQIVTQTIVGDLRLQTEGLQDNLVSFYGLPAGASADEVRRQLGISAGVIASGQNSPNTAEYLAQWNLVHFAGDYKTPVDGIIILGGAVNEALDFSASFDVGLMLGLGRHPAVKAGVECSEAAVSYMSEYQQLRLSTIDNVDQLPGEYALVMVLNKAEGNFGVKPTARELAPAWFKI